MSKGIAGPSRGANYRASATSPAAASGLAGLRLALRRGKFASGGNSGRHFDRYESRRGPRKQDGRHVLLAAQSCRQSGAEEALSDLVARVGKLRH